MSDVVIEARNRVAIMRQDLPTGTLRVQKSDIMLIERLAQQAEEVRQLLDDCKRGHTVLKRKVSLHESEVKDLKEVVKGAQIDKESSIAQIRNETDSALAELGALREKIKELEPQLEDMRRERGDLITERSQLRHQLESSHRQLQTGRAGEEEMRGDYLAMQQERDANAEKLTKVKQQLINEQETSAMQQNTIDAQAQELERLTRELAGFSNYLPSVLANVVERIHAAWVGGTEPNHAMIQEELEIELRSMKETRD